MRAKEFITEGYTLRAVNRSKFLEPGSEVDYVPDINVKSTDYEIVNNKTGQVVGNAAWASDDYMGPGDLFIYMNNGAQRSIKVKNDPQAAFNHFVKQQKTSRKYKEAVGETASAGASSAGAVASVSMPMGTVQKRKKKVHEAMDDKMVEVVFNNENAMELAYSKFDFDWQGDMMFIEEKYLGQLEDLLFSHGFDEPEDFEIDPEDPMLKDYDAYESKEEKQHKKLPYDEFVKGAKLKEPRTPRGKGERQPKMGVK